MSVTSKACSFLLVLLESSLLESSCRLQEAQVTWRDPMQVL